MTADVLEPNLDLLTEEYVLVQAWKKTASYIRNHNWFSDTLELDRTAVNLPRFLGELAERLKAPEQWQNDPLRIVPAPKSQRWRVNAAGKRWEPLEPAKTASKLRPLAHVSLKDQVAAAAVMLCLADRVETLQFDPREEVGVPLVVDDLTIPCAAVVSHGNRLFCDADGKRLRHRWGSAKLYRGYYQDYQAFLSRPEIVAEEKASLPGSVSRIVIVHSDLRQFYDRVRPELLAEKISALGTPSDDPRFYVLARRILDWEWHRKDASEVSRYAQEAGIPDFNRVALPQGLVAAGFFANVALLDFDQALRDALCQEIFSGVRLVDACRYVDDMRIVIEVERDKSLPEIEKLTADWLQRLLDRQAQGLKPAGDKTRAVEFRGDERPLVRQSRAMARIQSAVSGGFDAIAGEQILDAVQGLIRSQQRYSEERTAGHGWAFLPIPDVRDATVSRFAAARYRSTYRSIRPLLPDQEDCRSATATTEADDSIGRSRAGRTRADLDDETRAFALGLIENWVEDPSNVRLLRIGLDLWPAADVLESVLQLLRPFTEKGGRRKAPRQVAWYCLSEIFRAAATETGFVEDDESLPSGVDIDAYRSKLQGEAVRLAALPAATLPWYLRQQVLLFLATSDLAQAPFHRKGRSPETLHYHELLRFLKGEGDQPTSAEFATLAVLARRSFLDKDGAVQLVAKQITARIFNQIAERDPSFALELLESKPQFADQVSTRLRDDLCLRQGTAGDDLETLAKVILRAQPNGHLRNELALLRFASAFLREWRESAAPEVVTPVGVFVKLPPAASSDQRIDVKIEASSATPAGSMYRPPEWCPANERWRFHLGYLLRFILSARQDFTRIVQPYYWKERTDRYRPAESHWYQRLYGLFNGHSAFGDDWLPISDWIETLLFALLRWPGCRRSDVVDWVRDGIGATLEKIDGRLRELSEKQGVSGTLILPLTAPSPIDLPRPRPLRACVVQTVIPAPEDFKRAMEVSNPPDLSLSNPAVRRRHRNHLSAALAAIERMLELRKTHEGGDGRLDWLILPELSVHPRDVKTHLVPFAREHKAIVLAGLTYQELFTGEPMINSAIWVIPVWSAAHGLQVLTRRQGKKHLAASEKAFNVGHQRVQGFRPCQWLIGYEWSTGKSPLWLTAAVCYDATDLALAADLRHHSDVFAIPALNKDVGTFDQMALALHYHMFQMVIVANNGRYGGSNAYFPHQEPFIRQVFHLHGQPQATVAFLEIDDIADFVRRKTDARTPSPINNSPKNVSTKSWKYPPAGL